jgi:hypothetical protein
MYTFKSELPKGGCTKVNTRMHVCATYTVKSYNVGNIGMVEFLLSPQKAIEKSHESVVGMAPALRCFAV